MSLTCAISGKPPQIPVINRVSGLIYEKSLIVKYLKELHKDPVTGQETTEEDLIQLNTNSFVRPRVSAAASLPSLIKMLQDEYDAVALETYTLRKQLETCRQELSHSLYQHDAACRVIARLTKERDEARNALANLAAGSEKNKTSTEIENKSNNSEHVNMPQDVIEKINSTSEVLQAERKEKKKPADLTTKDKIAYFKEKNNFYSIHSASSAGILCLSLHDQHPNWILTGGVDKKVVLYDIFADSVVHTYQGHTKKVTCCELHPSQDLVISGSADAQVRIFSTSADKLLHVFTSHFSGVTSLSIHPTNDLMASSDSAGSWSFHDLSRQSTYQTSVDPNKSCINCGSIHPDGILYGSGLADSMVRIWDIRTASPVVAFEGHKGPVNGLSFSGNGYLLATSGEDNIVRLWDLRKCTLYKNIELEDSSFGLSCISFDSTGTYFAIGGAKDVKIFMTRQLPEIVTLRGHSKEITAVKFRPLADGLVTASKDRSVRVWGQ